jgi:hypothetical protein
VTIQAFVKEAAEIQLSDRTVKTASLGRHGLELAGLGTLAAPSVQELRHKPMSEKNKAKAEVAGLGMLAAPYAHDIAKAKSSRYANLAGRVLGHH